MSSSCVPRRKRSVCQCLQHRQASTCIHRKLILVLASGGLREHLGTLSLHFIPVCTGLLLMSTCLKVKT